MWDHFASKAWLDCTACLQAGLWMKKALAAKGNAPSATPSAKPVTLQSVKMIQELSDSLAVPCDDCFLELAVHNPSSCAAPQCSPMENLSLANNFLVLGWSIHD